MGARRGEKSGDLLLSVLSSPIWRRTKRPLVIIVPSFSPLRSIIWTLEEEEEEGDEMEREDRLDRVLPPSHPRLPRGFSSSLVGLPSTTTTLASLFVYLPLQIFYLALPPSFVGKKENFLGIYIGLGSGFFPLLSCLCWHCCADILADCKSVIALGTRSV